ncbi:hypothetical protein MVEN_02198500 [Mycena venus]|uniref:F-box domain-containing protein n=1 Tax=Mycena venus TaxID=2733690 RepID=A0A8H6X7B0_9AGAR|nr:hypothetical protein MVEN_02198500 [Mycena venus]
MNNLPNELLDYICCFLERRDLWAVVRLSSRFRLLALLPYLSRFGISEASIQAGTLELADSFSPIIIVARIKPIRRLICFQESIPGSYLRFQILASVLAATAPIPDIVIYDRYQMLTTRATASLLSRVPSSATNTLVVVKGSTMYLSRPRPAPPIQWVRFPPSLGSFNRYERTFILIFGIPLLLAYLFSGVINFGVLSLWVWRRLFGSPWSQEERIIKDTGQLVFHNWMRIQILPGRLTLVTLARKPSPLVLRPIRGLTPAAFSSILASLDLGVYLQRLRVERKTNSIHSELMAFLKRHPDIINLHLEPDSLQSSSLTTMSVVPDPRNNLHMLTAPASYIPYLLPAVPNVQRVTLLFTPVPKRVSAFWPATFDLPAYRTALAALAGLPGTHPIVLELAFRLTVASLPWLGLPDTEAMDMSQYPETRLVRVHWLWLSNDGPKRFRASDIRALFRWLGLFPGLQRLTFGFGAVDNIPAAERALLADAICRACRGINSPQDIDFHISSN